MTLSEARFKSKTTQLDLAVAAGISQSKVSLIERGYVVPCRRELEKLANALGLQPEDIELVQSRTARRTAA